MEERIGIYGGSFNPIHFGHIHLAIDMLEKQNLDKILFCPASLNPLKRESKELVTPDHRLAMLKLAILDIPQFAVLESELQRPAPSYTIDTVKELLATAKHQDPRAQYFLIVGQDTIKDFHLWNRARELVDSIEIFVGIRSVKCDEPSSNSDPVINEALKTGFTQTRVFEVSSTEIRDRIARGKYCGHLVPSKVLDYIYRNRLYL